MKHVIDAHALLWFMADDPRLGANAGGVLGDPKSELVLPAIALAESCWILDRGRLALSVRELLQALDADPRIQIYPLDEEVVRMSQGLISVGEMHDRLIVATALVLARFGEAVALLTRDQNIIEANLVPVVW